MEKSERLLSLDVFRGITIAGMILVNNPGTWNTIYPPLKHAEWNGCTPTDLIFPFFLMLLLDDRKLRLFQCTTTRGKQSMASLI
jgi:predicted acyltransferase